MGFGDDCVHASQRILHEVRYSLFPSRFTFAVIRNAVTIPNESTSSPWVRNVIPSEQTRHQVIDSIHPADNRHRGGGRGGGRAGGGPGGRGGGRAGGAGPGN